MGNRRISSFPGCAPEGAKSGYPSHHAKDSHASLRGPLGSMGFQEQGMVRVGISSHGGAVKHLPSGATATQPFQPNHMTRNINHDPQDQGTRSYGEAKRAYKILYI